MDHAEHTTATRHPSASPELRAGRTGGSKVDLAENRDDLSGVRQTYEELGYPVLLASALTGESVPALRDYLRVRITVLSGLSGVGKSSFLGVVQPGLDLRTGTVIRHWGGQGQHTTTQVRLLALDGGGYVAYTPGIRDMAVSGLAPSELALYYPDLVRAAVGCRFADCVHVEEAGCAVRTAVTEGRLAATRCASYRAILGELSRGRIDSNRSHFVRLTGDVVTQ